MDQPPATDRSAPSPARNPPGRFLHTHWRTLVIGGCLWGLVAWLYGPTVRHEFVNFDDGLYVYDNPHVVNGVTPAAVAWVFTHSYGRSDTPNHWIPLTGLSHMVDCQLYGLWPGGHHLTNVLLHAVTTILLFLVLRQLTGHLWPSAWVAALVAVHPLNVETVAWIAERKGVLSALFFVLTLGAYGRYARRPFGWGRYLLVGALLTLGLLAKPILVTLPLVLLLLDYWPLRRTESVSWWRLGLEKIPLLLLAGAVSLVTLAAQHLAKVAVTELTLGRRIATATVAYAFYLQKMIWPVDLTCFYPHPGQWPWLTVVMAGLVLAGGLGAAVMTWRRAPALLVGWCWYLGMLVPVIGLVQVGGQAYADRYVYLPLIGVWIALAWGVRQWAENHRARQITVVGLGIAAVAACACLAAQQVRVWRDSRSLYRQALAVIPDNWLAHYNLGVVLAQAGQWQEALPHFAETVRLQPLHDWAHNYLGLALHQTGQPVAAIPHFQAAIRILPDYAEAHANLGRVFAATGQLTNAIHSYERALLYHPASIETRNNLGAALTDAGRFTEAIDHYQQALRLDPTLPEAHYNLGVALRRVGRAADAQPHFAQALRRAPALADRHEQFALTLQQAGQLADAIAQYQLVLETRPDALAPLNNLAWLRATAADPAVRDGAAAVRLAERAAELTGRRLPEYLDTLAAAYAEAGRWPEAVATAEQAQALARTANQTALAAEIAARLEQYRAGRAWREPGR